MLRNSSTELGAGFPALFLDLDGVVYRSAEAVVGAVETLTAARESAHDLRFLTNNASRTPQAVAQRLGDIGLEVEAETVVTSAIAIADVMARDLPSGSRVFMVGASGLHQALLEVGLVPVDASDESITAVVQGHSVETDWRDLANAGYLISANVPWYASNKDLTVPTNRGIAPGNGAFVRLLEELTMRKPVTAGKPETPLFEAALRTVRGPALMIGDRLDTDIEGARRAGVASAWVDTGVHSLLDVMNAKPCRRPDYLLHTLSGLFRTQRPVHLSEQESRCGSARAVFRHDSIHLTKRGHQTEDEMRAAVALAWHIRDVVGFDGWINATLEL